MIEKLWELGTLQDNETGEPEMGYKIEMMWHEGEEEKRKSFEGTDVPQILQDAMRFIIYHYKPKNNESYI